MKGEDFLRELNNLEESIIEEAREITVRKKKKLNGNIVKFIGLAACIAVFTGAVIARSVGVQTKKAIYPAEESKSEEIELFTEQNSKRPSSADIEAEEEKQIVWMDYDVNRDGTTDTITVNILEDYESIMAECTITDGSSQNMLYQITFLPAYPEWGELYLCEREGFIYFIEYRPVLYQGTGQYQYEVFFFNENLERTTINQNAIFFDLTDFGNSAENVDKMAGFYYEINSYLSDSMLLVSTVNYEIQYSEENNILLKQEEYQFLYEYDFEYTQENMYEKLKEYFLCLNEYLQYTTKHITLVLQEDTMTSEGASFELINTSGIEVYVGEAFQIEELKTKEWKMCDYVNDAVGFEELQWEVKDGTLYSFTVDWSNIYGKLEDGSYRLVKNVVLSENISIDAVCYFDIYEVADSSAAIDATRTPNIVTGK